MTYRALRVGQWPPGLHWTEGETRELGAAMVEAAADFDVPAWLVPVAAPVSPVEAPADPEPTEEPS